MVKQNKQGSMTKTDGPDMDKHRELPQTEMDRELEKLLQSHRTVIKVFGAGGAGNNTVTRLMQLGIENVETFAANTDAQDLLYAQANHKVLIGRNITNGLGAGSDPKIGEESARENQDEIKELLVNTDLVFVTCGLGGGTGTGSAPVIAELAREAGALTIAIVTLPFSEEGVMRWNNAQYGLEGLRKHSDTLIVIQNDKLWEIAPEVPLDEAFKTADEILVNAVKGITELVTQKGLVNLDFADIRTIMKDGGTALIGMAESDSPDRAIEAVERAVENPLIDLDINGAKSALLNITGGKDMTIKDAKTAMQTLARKLDKSAKIIWGARINPELDRKVRVMIIATGLQDRSTGKLFKTETSMSLTSAGVKEVKKSIAGVIAARPMAGHETPATVVNEEAAAEAQKNDAKKIFREILEEEADADLKTIRDLLGVLQQNPEDAPKWEELRKTCSSLAGSAQMFDFDEIGELMTAVDDLLVRIIEKGLFTIQLLQQFNDVPDYVQLMIYNEAAANEWAKSYKANIENITKFLGSSPVVTMASFQEKLKEIWSPDIAGNETQLTEDTLQLSEKEATSTVVTTESKTKNDGNTESRFSSVDDVVKFVDNLLRGDSKDQKE